MRRPSGLLVLISVPLTVLVMALFASALLTLSGCDSDSDDPPDDDVKADIEAHRPQVTAFCSGCHGMPDPASFPKDAWHHEVEKAYGFFHDSNRDDLKAPPMSDVVGWFRSQAPKSLSLKASKSTRSPITFRREVIRYDSPPEKAPSISEVFFQAAASSDGTTRPVTQFCDMQNGLLGTLSRAGTVNHVVPLKLSHLQNPAHIEATDLDGDGRVDYLISELGSYLPEDHKLGKVIWYRPELPEESASQILFEGVGRVADARPADFDGDGDLDLVIAEFGWFKTGGIHILKQTQLVDGVPQFEATEVDKRHGTINVPVTDLDKDGDLDFVALISQEYEEVAAFLNRGDGTFERQIIHPGSDPAYGSGGIELTDIDGDDDLDVLYVNGDSLDSNMIKPYHAVQWLENEGDFPFRHRLIDRVPGACRAIAGDMDNDGDSDIVVGAWIPPKNSVSSADADGKFDTLMWFEQQSRGGFERHSLVRAESLGFMSADMGDLDGDGDLDIIAGQFGQLSSNAQAGIVVLWNPGVKK